MTDLQDYMWIATAGQHMYIVMYIMYRYASWHTYYWLCTTSTCMCVCKAACGMGSMRQQLHLDHDEIMELNIFTNIDNEQFLFSMCIQTNIEEIIVQ